jgi:hypothetical protein
MARKHKGLEGMMHKGKKHHKKHGGKRGKKHHKKR